MARGSSVGIIGGGPGGLMTAYCLQKHSQVPFRTTIFEATKRLGGKILTNRFACAPVFYEAGAAELYDYSVVGPDPLRELIEELGLSTTPMDGSKVIIDPLLAADGSRGPNAWTAASDRALERFDRRAREWMSPRQFYHSDRKDGDGDPFASQNFQAVLSAIADDTVRRHVEIMIHSDLATEPHLTNASYGLQNYLMNDPAYMRLYTIDGGIERLPQELAKRIEATVLFERRVERIEAAADGRLRVTSKLGPERHESDFDYVVVALPNHLLPTIDWAGTKLTDAMQRHHTHYDYPAHYLRISIIFERPFWRPHLRESYFMHEAFGGCCIYDESSRNGNDTYGVLGWLLGGEPAATMSELSDADLTARVLDSLPAFLQGGRDLVVEARVHRWVREVNGLPAGYPPRTMEIRHRPEPVGHPNLLVVGDYLFDSTLNGVLDSADFVAEWLAAEMSHHRSLERSAAS